MKPLQIWYTYNIKKINFYYIFVVIEFTMISRYFCLKKFFMSKFMLVSNFLVYLFFKIFEKIVERKIFSLK